MTPTDRDENISRVCRTNSKTSVILSAKQAEKAMRERRECRDNRGTEGLGLVGGDRPAEVGRGENVGSATHSASLSTTPSAWADKFCRSA